MEKKRVLILYYSFSSQTRNLLQSFVGGIEEHAVEVYWQQLKTCNAIQFPLGSYAATFTMMLQTFLRRRMPLEALENQCYAAWDLIVVAGPTWSYNPSGPILSLLDRESKLFDRQKVLPFISCRRYWRMHHWTLRRQLQRRGAEVLNPLIFQHVGREPWITIGVFLKLAGKVPESGKSWFRKYYPKYGHSREQVEFARRIGTLYAEKLCAGEGLAAIALPPVLEVNE